MTKVYLLTIFTLGLQIVKLFSTKEKAKEYLKRHSEATEDYLLEECLIDED